MSREETQAGPTHTPTDPSWASIVNRNRTPGFSLNYIKPKDLATHHLITVPHNLVLEGSQKWENTLVGHFIGRKLPFSLVKYVTGHLWTKAGLSNMLATDNGYCFFQFGCKDESESVLEGRPWHVAGQPILLRK